MKICVLMALLVLTASDSFCDDTSFDKWPGIAPVPQILTDPKTKVVFYLESDRRHVSAISPEGKLLWCSEIVRIPDKNWRGIKESGIDTIRFADPQDRGAGFDKADREIRVEIFGEDFGGMTGYIDKKTGNFRPGSVS